MILMLYMLPDGTNGNDELGY